MPLDPEDIILVAKYQNWNALIKSHVKTTANLISQLNAEANMVLKLQAYRKENPDLNMPASESAELLAMLAPVFTNYIEVKSKLDDFIAVSQEAMTVQDSITKYSIDLTAFSNELK